MADRRVPLRILVVEDEVLIAEMVRGILDDLGYQCLGPITTLAVALLAARTESFDGAILNLVIDGENAYAVAEVIAERGIPFAFASGVPRGSIDPKWHDRPYLPKPYVMADISRWLKSFPG